MNNNLDPKEGQEQEAMQEQAGTELAADNQASENNVEGAGALVD